MNIVKYFSVIFAGMMLFYSCKNENRKTQKVETTLYTQNETLKALTEKINADPENARLYYERGLAFHEIREDSLALFDFDKAVKLDSTKAEYYSAVGDLLFDHKDIEGSVVWLKKAIELNPNDPKAHLKIAKMFVYLRDYPKAFIAVNKVLKEDAMIPEAYYLKGIIYKDIKDTTKAISSFLTAIQIMPTYKDALMELGFMYEDQNDPVALKYFENAFKADTMDVTALYAKGMYYQERKTYEAAKQEYKRCIGIDRNFANAYFNTGYILMHQDSLEKARKQFDLVTKIEPMNADAYYNRGLCNEMMNKNEAAIADYKQALSFNKDYQKAQEGINRLKGK